MFCLLLTLTPQKGLAQFQNIYGTSNNNQFNRVIPDGPDFYVLGWTDIGLATVSRINGAGVLQWTHSLGFRSSWADGVVVPTTGNLIMVGSESTRDHSIIGELTRNGVEVCVKLLDEPGLETLFRIEANPGGSTYSVMGFHNTPFSLRDVVVYNISPGCTINNKQIFFSSANDEFHWDMEVMSTNGDIIVSGLAGNNAIIYRVNSNGNFVNGVQGPAQYYYSDLAETANGELLAIATRNFNVPTMPPRVMRFDANMLPVWEISVNGMISLEQVVDGGNGDIYLVGAAQFSSSFKPIVVKINDSNGSPTAPIWTKYLDNLGNFNTGNLVLTPTGLASADGVLTHPNGFGQLDAILAVTDRDLTSNCTLDTLVTLTAENTLFDGPAGLNLMDYEFPQDSLISGSMVDWDQISVCNTPCEASFTINYIDNCGHVQVTSTSTGTGPLTYQWCNGETTANLDLQLPCGEHTICVTVTCADNTTSTATQTITITDNIPPTINCPQDMTFTAFHPNCRLPVHNIHSLGATDNCGVPTVDYTITGATTASGTPDASGTVFNAGTSMVTYTATDWCMNMTSCSFDITVNCDTCACLGFQNLEFYNFLGLPNISVDCDSSPVLLPCIGPDAIYSFQWQLLCSDPMCMQSVDYVIVAASGGPALLSGTVTGIPFLNFSYGQLSGAGNYQLILTGHCGTDSCTCIINFSLPECCTCGGFSDMTFRPTQGGMNVPVVCGDTLAVLCDQVFNPQISGLFQCVGTQCPFSIPLGWVLNDPLGNPIQNGSATGPNFNIALLPAWFNDPGLYTLTITGNCGGQTCELCVFYLQSEGCTTPDDLCCLEWVGKFGGLLFDESKATAVDAAGNVFIAGNFSGTVDFDPGPNTFNLTSFGGRDIFIVKLSASGSFLWVAQIGGVNPDNVNDISVDASGNVYATGVFSGPTDFDPGSNTYFLNSLGAADIFLLKLDPIGGFLWASRIGSNVLDISNSIALDASGDLYITGNFNGAADFDPGPGVTTLTPVGLSDVFISKFSSTGLFIWARQIGDTGQDIARSIAVGQLGDIHITGTFSGTVDFDPGPGVFNLVSSLPGINDIFVAKLDAAGGLHWANSFSGVAGVNNSSSLANSIAVDAQGSVFTTGLLFDPVDFDPGPGTAVLTPTGVLSADIFVSKLTTTGTFDWVRQMGSTTGDGGESIVTDAQGNVYTIGGFSGTTDFDPGAGTFNLHPVGGVSMFIQKLDPSGNFVWAKQVEGESGGFEIFVDANNAIYCAGIFRGTSDFDPGLNTDFLSSSGDNDGFVLKLSTCPPPTPCTCGTFSDMFIRGPQGAFSQPVMCGGPPLNIGCPTPGVGYTLTGNFQCEGTECPNENQMDWDLLGPDGSTIASGTTQANSWFVVQLASAYFAQSGVYTLTLTGHCGDETCPCVIEFLVEEGCMDTCPCDLMDLQADANQGFASTLWSTSCRACFSPLALNDCDMVEWLINNPVGTPVGTSMGNQTFCHTFPGAGTYTIYMVVTRKRADGSLCESVTKAQTVNVTCLFRPDCDASVFANPRFAEGAMAGILNDGGASTAWHALAGNPVVIEGEPESHDGWTIQLTGNLDSADVLTHLEAVCLAKDTGTVSIALRLVPWGDPHVPEPDRDKKWDFKVKLYQGDDFETNNCDASHCLQLASIDLSPFDTGWAVLEIPYDLRGWTAQELCSGVLVRPAIYISNPFGTNQGGAENGARIQLDNFCVDGLLVGVRDTKQEGDIRLFPNPTTGMLTLRFDGPTSKACQLQVLDLWGRTVNRATMAPGQHEHSVSMENLPTGIYFIKVWKEGVSIWVEKVVKQ
ncbi:MAG: hypothetical protein DHS20C18_25500 [Saprospiraceae bacterium]|nr:MAG: hypothetical protein DHS20C18_25500 [Saprospiraceae bacterium]